MIADAPESDKTDIVRFAYTQNLPSSRAKNFLRILQKPLDISFLACYNIIMDLRKRQMHTGYLSFGHLPAYSLPSHCFLPKSYANNLHFTMQHGSDMVIVNICKPPPPPVR
jgi:hypothetical protein